MNTRPFLALHKFISVLVHIYILVYYYSMAIIMKCPASKFFFVVVLLHKRFHFMLQQMEIKELSNTKKNLEFCRIMFRSPVLGYEKVKCTEMHFKKKFVLICFFFHWLGLLSSCQII